MRKFPKGYYICHTIMAWLRLKDESFLVVFDKSGDIYNTNPLGLFILDRLLEEKPLDQIEKMLVKKFGVKKTQARLHLARFIRALEKRQLFFYRYD